MLLSQAIDMFVETRKGDWKARYAKEACRGLELILLAVGDENIKNIKRRHLRDALAVLEALPKGNVNPYNKRL